MAAPVIAPNGVPIYRIDRGGEVTFHGPGQLVVYPLLDLKRCPMLQDLHWYLRQIEQVIIDTLHDDYDIPTTRDPDHTGVWYQNEKGGIGRSAKIAAVGVSASRWVTTHGFALNVRPTLQYFDASYIVPCGIHDKGVTSMEQIWREEGRNTELPTVEQVAMSVVNKMESVFGITVEKNAIIKIQ
jgi:lipoate-protein ligase B